MLSDGLQWIAELMRANPSGVLGGIVAATLALTAVVGVWGTRRENARAAASAPTPEIAAPSVSAPEGAVPVVDEPVPVPREAAPEPVSTPVETAPPPAPAPEPAAEPEPQPELAPAPEPVEPEPVEPEAAPRVSMRERLRRTRDAFVGRLGSFGGRTADAELFEELETLLFTADLGVSTAEDLLERVRREASGKDGAAVREVLRTAMAEKLAVVQPQGEPLALSGTPHVILVLGVNGSGKTTTIGKLAARYVADGKKVVLGAGDTFRAAAREQLQTWGERTGAEVIVGPDEGDPAAVAFDTVKAATARGADVAIIDTAGRLQTQKPLMEELSKIARVIGRDDETAPHETLLVLDSNTGQNALSQAKQFTEAAPVTGLVLTKLDGTAKGGVIVGLADEFQIPVKFIGVGEGVEDLREFDAEEFVTALFAE